MAAPSGVFKARPPSNFSLNDAQPQPKHHCNARRGPKNFRAQIWLSIASGSSLTLGGTNSIGIAYSSTAAPHSGAIDGTFKLGTSATGTYNAANAVTTINGTFEAGAGTNTLSGQSLTSMVFKSGSNYNVTSNSIGAGLLATWEAGSNMNVTGLTSSTTGLSNANRFWNLTWNSTSQTSTLNLFGSSSNSAVFGTLTVSSTGSGILRMKTSTTTDTISNIVLGGGTLQLMNGAGTTTITGNVTQTGGTFDFNGSTSSGLVRLFGNFSSTGGTVVKSGANAAHRLEFKGTSLQTITGLPSGLIQSYILNNAAGINAGGLTINQGASLTLTNGSLGAAATYAGTANTLVYNYANSITATTTEWPATDGPVSVTVALTGTSPDNILTVPFNRTLGATGILTLTTGMFNNTGYTLTVPNPTTGAITSHSSTEYITGAVERALPASGTLNFPVGKSTYNPLELVTLTTTAAGAVSVKAEAFEGSTGGSAGAGIATISNTRYWSADITSGAGNLTSTFVRLNDAAAVAGDVVANSATLTGAYTRIGGFPHTVVAGTSVTSVAPAVNNIAGYYLVAAPAPPAVTNVAITPTGNQCTNVLRTVTADVTPAGDPIATVEIKYQVNGGTVQTVAMTNTGGNTWSGDIPTVTPANGTVTWSVVAADAGGLSSTVAGTSYKDEPLFGATATVNASPNPVCAGSVSNLSVTLAGAPVSGQVGIGTSTTSSNGNTPFNGLYEDSRVQYLVLASELQASGLSAGNINSLAFNVTTANTTSLPGYTVKIAQTSTSALTTTFETPAFTTVYGPATVQGSPVGWKVFTFAAPFAWDGTSNLLVQICHDADAWSGNATVEFTATSFNSVLGKYDDGVSGACDATVWTYTASSQVNRPNMRFDGVSNFPTYSWSDGTNTVGTTPSIQVTPSSNTSYSVTLTYEDGCTLASAPQLLTVNPLPAQPIGGGSTQCGTGVPAAFVVSDFTPPSANNDGFRWYDAPTGGNLIQTGGATYTGSINTTTVFYVSETDGTCESLRTAVTATVNPPDAVTALIDDNEICLGETANLSITQTGSNQTYTFNWNSSTGSGLSGATPGAPVTAALAVTPTAAGNYTYEVTAVDGSCTTTSTVNLTVNALPVITSATATPATVCAGVSSNLVAETTVIAAGEATLGTATTTTSTTGGTPFSGVYEDARIQYLVLASELQAIGMAAGNITSLAFDITSENTTALDYTVKMAHSSATALGTSYETGTFTTVFNAAPVTPSPVGWKTLNFSTPFNWDGTSNIIIEVCHDNDDWDGNATVAYTSTSFNSVLGKYDDGVSGACTYDSWSSFNIANNGNRPNMRFNAQVGTTGAGTLSYVWNPGGLTGNSVTVTPMSTQAYTVSATDPVTGCVNTAGATVTVNQLPPAPTASNGSHCGDLLPFASVSSNSGAPAPIYNWYDAATGGNLVQTGTDASYMQLVSITTTWWVSETSPEGCEGPRVAVTEDVIEADPVTASADEIVICLGESVNLDVTQNGSTNFYDYTWNASPEAGSGLVNGTVGQQQAVTPTASGVYEYQVTAEDFFAGCFASSSVQVTVTALPVITAANAVPVTQCAGSDVVLAANAIVNATGNAAIGAGVSTSSSSATPFYGGWGGTKVSYIYTAAELLTFFGSDLSSFNDLPGLQHWNRAYNAECICNRNTPAYNQCLYRTINKRRISNQCWHQHIRVQFSVLLGWNFKHCCFFLLQQFKCF
ncbi:MAG: hypothetical protein EOP49_05035 [Sphingobacteriales bacterium]|nr:MAG: hypothetical protein EOP49_05035 [Sphingobacteriales bacterium]